MRTADPRGLRIRNALAALPGRNSIDEVVVYLERLGLFDFDIIEAKRELARGELRKLHRWARKSGRLEDDQISLFEIEDDGTKVHYYKRAGDLTIDEAGKHLDSLRGTVERNEKILTDYAQFYTSKFGDDIQGHFAFNV